MKKITDLMLKLNEIDFKTHGAYKRYKTKHKMRPTTKVTIGGKETTAGEADKVVKKADAIKRGAPETDPKALDQLAKVGMKDQPKAEPFQFSEYDYETPKEFRDEAKDILKKTYDLDKVDPDELEQIIKSADDYFYQEARSENKRGREVDPTRDARTLCNRKSCSPTSAEIRRLRTKPVGPGQAPEGV